jgi:hypothetical protein
VNIPLLGGHRWKVDLHPKLVGEGLHYWSRVV